MMLTDNFGSAFAPANEAVVLPSGGARGTLRRPEDARAGAPRQGQELLDLVEALLVQTEPIDLPGIFVPEATGRPHIRKLRLLGFQYNLLVDTRAAQRMVLAVAHGAREPGYWLRRT